MVIEQKYSEERERIIGEIALLSKTSERLSMLVPLCGNEPEITLTEPEFREAVEATRKIEDLLKEL